MTPEIMDNAERLQKEMHKQIECMMAVSNLTYDACQTAYILVKISELYKRLSEYESHLKQKSK